MESIKEIQEKYFIISKELNYNESWKEYRISLLAFSKYAQECMIQDFTFEFSFTNDKIKSVFKRIKLMSNEEIQLAIDSLVYIHSKNSKESPFNGISYLSVLSNFIIVRKKSDWSFELSDFTKDFLSLVERKHISDIKISIDKILDYLELYLDAEDIRYYVGGEIVIYEVFYTENLNQLK